RGGQEVDKETAGDKETAVDKETRRQGDKETRRQGDKETRNTGAGITVPAPAHFRPHLSPCLPQSPCLSYCRCRSNIPVTVRYAHQAPARHLQSIFTWASVPGWIASSGSSISTETRYSWACGTYTPGRCAGFVATVPPALEVRA